jgi:hypothetical protein
MVFLSDINTIENHRERIAESGRSRSVSNCNWILKLRTENRSLKYISITPSIHFNCQVTVDPKVTALTRV